MHRLRPSLHHLRRDWNGKRGMARTYVIHKLQLIYMVNFTKPNHISRVFGGVPMPMVALGGALVADKTGLAKKMSISDGDANSGVGFLLHSAFWGSLALGFCQFPLWGCAILGMALSVGRFSRRSGPILGIVFCFCTFTYSATTTMAGIPIKPMLKVFHTTSIKDRPNTAASDGAVKGQSNLMVSEVKESGPLSTLPTDYYHVEISTP